MTNDKGLTLIEILAAITLFGVIISIFLSLFSDNLVMSNRVENELDAIHVAERAAEMVIADSKINQEIRNRAESCETMNRAQTIPMDSIATELPDFETGPESYVNYTTLQGETYNLLLKLHCYKSEEDELFPISLEVYRFSGEQYQYLTETYRYIKGEGTDE